VFISIRNLEMAPQKCCQRSRLRSKVGDLVTSPIQKRPIYARKIYTLKKSRIYTTKSRTYTQFQSDSCAVRKLRACRMQMARHCRTAARNVTGQLVMGYFNHPYEREGKRTRKYRAPSPSACRVPNWYAYPIEYLPPTKEIKRPSTS